MVAGDDVAGAGLNDDRLTLAEPAQTGGYCSEVALTRIARVQRNTLDRDRETAQLRRDRVS
jgi:hypothetical protein